MRVFIAANCQATAIAQILLKLKNADNESVFSVVFCKPIYELVAEDQSQFEALLQQTDILLYQPHKQYGHTPSWRTSDYWVKSTSATHCIGFPSLYFAGYNPELAYLRMPDGLHLNEGFSDYHDKRVVKLFIEGKSAEFICANYQSMMPSPADIALFLEETFAQMKKREQAHVLDIKLSTFIEQNYTKQKLFYTFNHPANSVLYEVVRQLLVIVGFSGLPVPQITEELLKFDSFPIVPSVAEHLKLTFSDAQNHYIIQNESFTVEQTVDKYLSIYQQRKEKVSEAFSRLGIKGWLARKKVIIHIGLSNTGTLSLQNQVMKNRDTLVKAGLLYPKSGLYGLNHIVFAQHYSGEKPSPKVIERLKSEITAADAQYALLSCEALENMTVKGIEALMDDFCEFDIHVVCGLRSRTVWARLLYAQMVRQGLYLKNFSTLLDDGQPQPLLRRFFRNVINSRQSGQQSQDIADFKQKLSIHQGLDKWLSFIPKRRVLVFDSENTTLWQVLGSAFNLDFKPVFNLEEMHAQYMPHVLTIEIVKRYYQAQGVSVLDEHLANRFVVKVEQFLAANKCNFQTNSHFESRAQLLNFLQQALDDELSLVQSFGVGLLDQQRLENINFVDHSSIQLLFQRFKDDINQLYHETRRELELPVQASQK